MPRFSANLRTLRLFYSLFDPAYEAHSQIIRYSHCGAVCGAWRVYRGMREVYAPGECVAPVFVRMVTIAGLWIAIGLSIWAAWHVPAVSPGLIVACAWFRYGVWHLWWSTVYAAAFAVFALLEAMDILALPAPEVEHPTLTMACLTPMYPWIEACSRRQVLVTAGLALVPPALLVAAVGISVAALAGLVGTPTGAVAATVAIGGILDPQRIVQRCLCWSVVLSCLLWFSQWPVAVRTAAPGRE